MARIGVLVAVAPLSEAGRATRVELAAGMVPGCFAPAALGRWPQVVRSAIIAPAEGTGNGAAATVLVTLQTLLRADARQGFSTGSARSATSDKRRPGEEEPDARSCPRWILAIALGVLTAVFAQGFVPDTAGLGALGALVDAAWVHQLGMVSSLVRHGAIRALVAALQLPLGVAGSLLHIVRAPSAVNERLWSTGLLATLTMDMVALLAALGLSPRATGVGNVLLYALNPYVFTMSELAVPYLTAMAIVPGLVSSVLWVARLRHWTTRQVLWAVTSHAMVAGGLGLVAGKPFLLLGRRATLAGDALLVRWLEDLGALSRALRRTTVGVDGLIAGCAYWAEAFALVLTSSSTVSAASRRHWQWAARPATLANNFCLNSSWDWLNRLIFPQASMFLHLPYAFWRYALRIAPLPRCWPRTSMLEIGWISMGFGCSR